MVINIEEINLKINNKKFNWKNSIENGSHIFITTFHKKN